jgi:hypothetical protein
LLPFEDDGSQQFMAPAEAQAPRRKWTKQERRERLAKGELSDAPEPAADVVSEVPTDEIPVQEKIEE